LDGKTDELHLHKKEKAGDEDLLESTAIQTLLNGGTVYVVKPGTMPDTGSLAAVLRRRWHLKQTRIPRSCGGWRINE